MDKIGTKKRVSSTYLWQLNHRRWMALSITKDLTNYLLKFESEFLWADLSALLNGADV